MTNRVKSLVRALLNTGVAAKSTNGKSINVKIGDPNTPMRFEQGADIPLQTMAEFAGLSKFDKRNSISKSKDFESGKPGNSVKRSHGTTNKNGGHWDYSLNDSLISNGLTIEEVKEFATVEEWDDLNG